MQPVSFSAFLEKNRTDFSIVMHFTVTNHFSKPGSAGSATARGSPRSDANALATFPPTIGVTMNFASYS